jgi:hypothetical protein
MGQSISVVFSSAATGAAFPLGPQDSLTYDVTGTYTGTITLERSRDNGATWQPFSRATAVDMSGTAENRTTSTERYRWVSEVATGSVTAVLADVDSVVHRFANRQNESRLEITDEGVRLYGEVTVNGGAFGGPATADGDAIDSTLTATTDGVIWDIEEVARPVVVEKNPGGNIVRISTTENVNALLDADDADWSTLREDGLNTYETITSRDVVGLQARVISGAGTSTVRVYARQTGPGYNPVFDPAYDVAFADTTDVQRFFRQAGFGEFPGEVDTVVSSGDTAGEVFDAWYDGTFNYLPGSFPVLAQQGAGAGDNTLRRSLAAGWLHRSLVTRSGSDTLRFRILAAFNKLCAVGPILAEQTSRAWEGTQNSLLGLLDGTLKDYVDWLAYARYPQWFLDNILNRARNLANTADIEPNQNFVREKLQLFTLGQWQLNLDGTFKYDSNGNRIPAYEYLDVLNMARLYSGFELSGGTQFQDATANTLICNPSFHYRGAVDMPTAGITRAAYLSNPSLGTKFVADETTVYGNIARVCEWIVNNDTFLVYIAKNFIHELVTENPTPQYVRRVVAALLNDGTGTRGSFKAMFRAILLDPEARGTAASKNALTYGRALDMHLAVSAAWRTGEQVLLAERNYVFTANFTNGSTAVTALKAALDPLRTNGTAFAYNVTGTGIPAAATIRWETDTTATLSAAFTGTTGAVTVTANRIPAPNMFEHIEATTGLDSNVSRNGVGRLPNEWGFPPTVFAEYPFDAEAAPGYLARAARIWTTDGVLAQWQTMVRASGLHSDAVTTTNGFVPRRTGIWDMTYMCAGTPTNAQLIDRAITVILAGRTLPAAARTTLIGALDQIMLDRAADYGVTDSQVKLERRGALAIGLVNMMPQAMEQI